MRLCFNFQYSHSSRILGTLLENNRKAVCQNKNRHTGLYFQESLKLCENLHIVSILEKFSLSFFSEKENIEYMIS